MHFSSQAGKIDGFLSLDNSCNFSNPCRIHICVTFMHTRSGVADNFVNDVETIVKELMKDPTKPVEGRMAIYGVAQGIPDRSIVGDFTKLYLDSLCFTPKKPKKLKKETAENESDADNQSKRPSQTESVDITIMNE